MLHVVAAVIERPDRRILIGQRRRGDTSPLKWEFPGGKVRSAETFEQALARELSNYDFLLANRELIANLATGRIKPSELLAAI